MFRRKFHSLLFSCVLLLISAGSLLTTAQTTPSYRLCVPENLLPLCNQMVEDGKAAGGRITCVVANDKIGCISKVVKNEADFLPLEPEEIYVAHRFEQSSFYVISEIRTLEFENRDFRYEPVAVIRNSAGIRSISDLQGKKSCHTGYGRNAGWKIPFSHLMDKNELPKYCEALEAPTIEKDLNALSSYFSAACAPGPWVPEKDVDKRLKERYTNLCSLCNTPFECSRNDKFSGYEGALKCLTEGSGDVAWTKMDAVEKFFKLKESTGVIPVTSEFSFLCWDGSSTPLTSTDPCSWAKRPWKAYLASRRLNTSSIKDLQEQITLYKTEGKKTTPSPVWMLKTLETSINDTEKHYAPNVAKTVTPFKYLSSKNYTVTIEKPSCATKKFIKLCVRSEVEKLKCLDLRLAAMGQRILPSFQCVLGESNSDCMEKIKDGEADVMTLSAKEAERAKREYELTPLLAELEDLQGDTGPYRFAVSVIRKGVQFTNISSLRGKRSCHGSIRSVAGWNIPISVLRDANEISGPTCGLTLEMAKYFNATCVPGAMDPTLNMNWLPKSLCGLCAGEESMEGGNETKTTTGFCYDDSAERYYGDVGAIRCLNDKVADVAFTDHVALRQAIPGLKSEELQLLCHNGKIMALDQAQHCNWGKVPSNKIIARSEEKDLIDREDARLILLKASENFKPAAKAEIVLKLFGPYYENSNLIFQDTSVGLIDESAANNANSRVITDFDFCTTSGAYMSSPNSLNILMTLGVLYTFYRIL